MSEWFKEHDWKSCVGLKPTGGSNPLLCASVLKGFSHFETLLFFAVFARFPLHTIFYTVIFCAFRSVQNVGKSENFAASFLLN